MLAIVLQTVYTIAYRKQIGDFPNGKLSIVCPVSQALVHVRSSINGLA
jgi:hypothetical protein